MAQILDRSCPSTTRVMDVIHYRYPDLEIRPFLDAATPQVFVHPPLVPGKVAIRAAGQQPSGQTASSDFHNSFAVSITS